MKSLLNYSIYKNSFKIAGPHLFSSRLFLTRYYIFFSLLLLTVYYYLLYLSLFLSPSSSSSSWPPLLTASTDLQATTVSALSHIFHAVVIYVFSFFLLFLGWINSLINTTKGKIPLPSSDSSTNNDWERAVLFVTWSNWYWYRVCK